MRSFTVVAIVATTLNIAINLWILAEIAVYGRMRKGRNRMTNTIRIGDKVRSIVSGRTYTVATFNDRYAHIDVKYVERYRNDFVKVAE